MTKDEMKYYLRRFRFLEAAVTQKKPVAIYFRGIRKQIIPINEDIITFVYVVNKALKLEENDYVRDILLQSLREGKSDIDIIAQNSMSKGPFYHMKADFTEKVFNLCVLGGLVTEEEIWE